MTEEGILFQVVYYIIGLKLISSLLHLLPKETYLYIVFISIDFDE